MVTAKESSPCNRALFLNGINHAKFRKLRLKLVHKQLGCLNSKSKPKVFQPKQSFLNLKLAHSHTKKLNAATKSRVSTGHESQGILEKNESCHVNDEESRVNGAGGGDGFEECSENVDDQINCNMEDDQINCNMEDEDTLVIQADPSNYENDDDGVEFCSAMEDVFSAIEKANDQLQRISDTIGNNRDRLLTQAKLLSEFAGQVSKLASTETSQNGPKLELHRSQLCADKENMFTPRREFKTLSKPHSMFPTPDSSICNEELDSNSNVTICNVCHKEFNTHSKLSRHKKESKCAEVSWRCSECKKLLTSLNSLRHHLLNIHQITFNKDQHQGMQCVTSTPRVADPATKSVSETSSLSVEDIFATSDVEHENSQKQFKSPHALSQNTSETKVHWQCPQCEKFFSSKANVKMHLRKVHDVLKDDLKEMSFVTKPATTSSTNEESVAEVCSMSRKVLGDVASNDTFIHCGDCQKKFKTPHLLQKHKDIGECEGALWQCHECKQFFSSQANVRKHLTKVHHVLKGLEEMSFVTKPADVELETSETVCDVCQKDLGTSQKLTRHQRTSRCAGLQWQCPQCDIFCRSRDSVATHMRKQHCKLTIKNVTFVTKPAAEDINTELTLSMVADSEPELGHEDSNSSFAESRSCAVCNKEFEDAFELELHLATGHTLDGSFTAGSSGTAYCDICFKDFITPEKLKAHKKGACGELQWQCCECLRFFSSRSSVVKHMRLLHKLTTNKDSTFVTRPAANTDEGTFCTVCSKYFAEPKSLQMHMTKSKCGGKESKCSVCLNLYSCRNNLLRHIKRDHQMTAKDYDLLTKPSTV